MILENYICCIICFRGWKSKGGKNYIFRKVEVEKVDFIKFIEEEYEYVSRMLNRRRFVGRLKLL